MSNKYQISSQTVKDIFEKVPAEKRVECIDEIKQMVGNMNKSEQIHRIVELSAKALSDEAELTPFIDSIPDVLEWVDDGKNEVVAVTSINGDEFMSASNKE